MGDTTIMLPPYKVKSCVQILAETQDYNHNIMNIPAMWRHTRGEGIKIVILDTGTPKHYDLMPAGGKSFIPGYSVDKSGHATHCAGIIAAIANNGMGVAGIAPDVDDYYGAVLDGQGSGNAEAIIKGIHWAVDVIGADIISMSLGLPAGNGLIKKWEDACNYAVSQGVAVFAAAGNERGKVSQPAVYDSVIAIAAVDNQYEHARFSNMGPEVDFAAGGVNVYSTYLNNSYARLSGTCIAQGTYIYTPLGSKKIEEMRVGDDVWAYKNGGLVTRQVANVLYQGKNTVKHIRALGRDVWATKTHRFLAFNRVSTSIEWVELEQLKDNHRLIIPKFDSSNTVAGKKVQITGAENVKRLGIDSDEFVLAKWTIDEEEREEDVFDLTVPDADCFVAHGLIAHNSMACPAASAVGALILSDALNDGKKLTPSELRVKLRKIAYDLGPDGVDDMFGHGIPIFNSGEKLYDGAGTPAHPPIPWPLEPDKKGGIRSTCTQWRAMKTVVETMCNTLTRTDGDTDAAIRSGIRKLASEINIMDSRLKAAEARKTGD